ncbi:hypothetical protein [Denitromonas iodatirespirans]|uniref:Uncharacterized protein n=1 Tax=Denitromonas iodatirespirans TaxID=2795389 RepID=A0A944DMK8_DENI1|nr:hypothetical protein [Denitromonas iodatirespirans]MBT0961414.1 hypothetical protein [Denitromonas iodatirespirans]
MLRSILLVAVTMATWHTSANAASPAAAVAIDPSRLGAVRMPEADESAAPTPPVRAYAIDGCRFYYGGQQYIIDGPVADERGDLARQRLQEILDGGELTVQPLGEKRDGSERALVRINGEPLSLPPIN